MRFIRKRTGLLATCAIVWQALILAVASVLLSCDRGPALEHAGMPGHEGMADCPMQKKEPACPLHAAKHGTHDCDCPSIGCSRTDAGLMAMFGTVGVLSATRFLRYRHLSLSSPPPRFLLRLAPDRAQSVE
jgi:hypothetical protein